MSTQAGLKPVRVSVMNAVHGLALLVARDEGLFRRAWECIAPQQAPPAAATLA